MRRAKQGHDLKRSGKPFPKGARLSKVSLNTADFRCWFLGRPWSLNTCGGALPREARAAQHHG